MLEPTPHSPYDPPACASATRIRTLLNRRGPAGVVFLAKAIPEHLYPLAQQLLEASSEAQFHQLREEALVEYASLRTPDKRELFRRFSTLFPTDELAELGRLLGNPPQLHAEANTLSTNTLRLLTALPPFLTPLLFSLGPELAERFVSLFESHTDESFERAWDAFNRTLAESPDRVDAALEHRAAHFMLTAFGRIVQGGRREDPPPAAHPPGLRARIGQARKNLRNSVLRHTPGLASTFAPLLARVRRPLQGWFR